MAKVLISKKSLKELGAQSSELARTVLSIQERYRNIKSFTLQTRPEGEAFIAGEGENYTFVYGGRAAGIEFVTESTMGASNDAEICPHCNKRRDEEITVGKTVGYGGGIVYYCCGHKIKESELEPGKEPPVDCPDCLFMAASEKEAMS